MIHGVAASMTHSFHQICTLRRSRCNLLSIIVVAWACCSTTNAIDILHDTLSLDDVHPTRTDSGNDGSATDRTSPIVTRATTASKRALPIDGFVKEGGPERLPKTKIFEVPSHILSLAGSKRPIVRTVLNSVSPKHERYLSVIGKSIQSMIHVEDIILLGFLSFMTLPIAQSSHEWLPSILPLYSNSIEFRSTLYYEIMDHIQQVARIALAIYCSDIIKLVVVGLGYKIPGMTSTIASRSEGASLPHAFGHIVYSVWIANRIGYLTRKLFRRYVNAHPESFGRINLIQKWIDALRHAATLLLVMHILKVESGVAVNRSFLAVGSVGTLAFGLASQGVATQVINGLLLASSDRIYEGDDVMLGSNGFAGNIVKLGWLETVIRGSDEIMISIPNADLLKERLSNLSRVRYSQVKQILRLRYDDVDKIPVLINQIKYEIKKNCPSVIVDGSRPFRVHWTAMNNDHCEITVDTRHLIKPVGDAYLENKQTVLASIYTALKRYNCKLVDNPIVVKVP